MWPYFADVATDKILPWVLGGTTMQNFWLALEAARTWATQDYYVQIASEHLRELEVLGAILVLLGFARYLWLRYWKIHSAKVAQLSTAGSDQVIGLSRRGLTNGEVAFGYGVLTDTRPV